MPCGQTKKNLMVITESIIKVLMRAPQERKRSNWWELYASLIISQLGRQAYRWNLSFNSKGKTRIKSYLVWFSNMNTFFLPSISIMHDIPRGLSACLEITIYRWHYLFSCVRACISFILTDIFPFSYYSTQKIKFSFSRYLNTCWIAIKTVKLSPSTRALCKH